MERILLAAAIMAVAAVAAEFARRRRRSDPPTQPRRELPSQLDRSDFDGDGWLVTVFTSDTCSTCADVVAKAAVVRSDEVTVTTVSFQARPDLHQRYDVDAVPCLVIADGDGVVHGGFLGPVTATDLWAAVAEAREPGSIDRSGGCGDH
jgi:hypothetical protein